MAEKPMNDLARDSLAMHARGRPGKLEIRATKPLMTQRDLSLAYSPGVATPCLEIFKDPSKAYDYTAKGNIVAVISNGTAVLGLGNLGALGAKPVMEGKAVLFKRFADIDGIDLEVDTQDVDEFVNCVRFLGKTFGGINLEDIKAPECFVIEERLRELLDIPVFHDDQHGTAIIIAAGLINALHLTGRTLQNAKIVVNGAGSAAVAGVQLLRSMGMPADNAIVCDSTGVIYRGRTEGMNQWKSALAAETKARTLADAMKGADVFLGLSVKDAVSRDMVASMAKNPIVFAMANPDPEITPEEVMAVRDDAIIATGRSDYPNQINNVLGFPYIFRGALDVRASEINDTMKIAAAEALAQLAREDVPDEVAAAYSGLHLRFGPNYIIPAPFDPRLIVTVPSAVAVAAMESGVARKPIADMGAYRAELSARLDPTMASLTAIFEVVRTMPQRVVFAEGEDDKCIRAAVGFYNAGYGTPILVGRENRIRETMKTLGIPDLKGIEIDNAALNDRTKKYADFLYRRLQRKGWLARDCQRMINQQRNIFAACMIATGDADAMVTGLTRSYHVAMNELVRVLDTAPDATLFGISLLIAGGHTVFLADTAVHVSPTPKQIADIAVHTAATARQMGHHPRVAILSFSSFGHPMAERAESVRGAMALLDEMKVDFEYDGEMSPSIALDKVLMDRVYPFCRLSGPANVLILPGLNAVTIAPQLLQKLGNATVIGPLLTGLEHSAQIVPLDTTVSNMVNMAALAAYGAIKRKEK